MGAKVTKITCLDLRRGGMDMESWIYAGVSDKYEILLHVSRLLAAAGAKVLLVDGTERQVYRYSIGQTDKSKPITEFWGFDVACGFFTSDSLKQYLAEQEEGIGHYDIVIYDLEKLTFCAEEDWQSAKGIYWVSSYDLFSLERSGEWFRLLFSKYPALEGMAVGIIFIRLVDSRIQEAYVRSFMEFLPITWKGESLKVPFSEGNYSLQLENEHNHTLRIKPFTRDYKRAIKQLAENMSGQQPTTTRSLLRSSTRRRVWANI